MTKVAQLFEEEKLKAVAEVKAEADKAKAEADKAKERIIKAAKTLLENNVDISIIMKSTWLSKSAILKLKK